MSRARSTECASFSGATQRRDAGAQYVHGVRLGSDLLESVAHRGWNRAQAAQLRLVGAQLGLIRQAFVNQQMCDFLEFTGFRDLENVVTAITQIVAGAAHGT